MDCRPRPLGGHLGANDEVVRILLLLGHVHRRLATFAGDVKLLPIVSGSAVHQFGNGFGDQFHMTDFFDTDALDEVAVGGSIAPEIEALE